MEVLILGEQSSDWSGTPYLCDGRAPFHPYLRFSAISTSTNVFNAQKGQAGFWWRVCHHFCVHSVFQSADLTSLVCKNKVCALLPALWFECISWPNHAWDLIALFPLRNFLKILSICFCHLWLSQNHCVLFPLENLGSWLVSSRCSRFFSKQQPPSFSFGWSITAAPSWFESVYPADSCELCWFFLHYGDMSFGTLEIPKRTSSS